MMANLGCLPQVLYNCLQHEIPVAHSFPPFFLFRQEAVDVLAGTSSFCTSKNWTDEKQTASNFLTPWKLPPPHDHEIAFSFQRCCLNNTLIGNHQCTYYSIVCALTISKFCFSCSFGRSYKKTLFSERLSTMRTMKHPLACFSRPSTTRQWRCVDAKAIATTPSSSLPRLCRTILCWGGWGDNDDKDDDRRGNDDAHNVQPHSPNTQQQAIEEGVD
jgi:hypothetical protein